MKLNKSILKALKEAQTKSSLVVEGDKIINEVFDRSIFKVSKPNIAKYSDIKEARFIQIKNQPAKLLAEYGRDFISKIADLGGYDNFYIEDFGIFIQYYEDTNTIDTALIFEGLDAPINAPALQKEDKLANFKLLLTKIKDIILACIDLAEQAKEQELMLNKLVDLTVKAFK